jgi:hypothetical protein
LVPLTSNALAVPGLARIIPADVVPLPQSILAAKSPLLPFRSVSVKVATTPAIGMPLIPWRAVPVACRGRSVTAAELRVMVCAPPASAIETATEYVPGVL